MKNFNDDDLADYDDEFYEEEWNEDEASEEEYNIVEKPKKEAAKKKEPAKPIIQKPEAPKVVTPLPVQITHVSGFTTNQITKLKKLREDLNPPFQVSTWLLNKYNSVETAKAALAKEESYIAPTVFVVIGHVDAGKSTLMAQLVNKYGGGRPPHKAKSHNSLAWDMDVGSDEREHGVTIDSKSKSLRIRDKEFVAIDAPGHADYVPSMLLGAMQADAAVLVIDCVKFDTGFSRGGQTKEHVSLIRSLGIHQLVIVLNKVDMIDSEDRFDELEIIKSQLRDFIHDEMKFNKVDFVPISAMLAQNIFNPAYPQDTETPCLEEALLRLEPKGHGPMHHSVCIPVVDINGDKVSGRVECGSVHDKEKLMVLPSRQLITLNVSSSQHPGSYLEGVQINFLDGSMSMSPTSGGLGALIHPGSVIVDPVFPLEHIECVEKFFARILVINDNFMPIVRGQSVTINVHTCMIDACISKIIGKVVPGSKTVAGPVPKCLVKGDVAVVEISVRKGAVVVVEPDNTTRVTGRVVIRDRGVTIAAGLIITTY
jgi:elongation factor 1 alpha-like protein